MDRVRARPDLVYKRDGALELKLDLYLPEASAPGKRVPVVFLIHGGVGPEFPVQPKDWGFYKTWGRLLAASGMGAVAFNHRVGFPDPNLAAASGDVEDAIAFVRNRAPDFSIDPERIALAAFSAGGPMLSMALREPRPSVRCLVAFYAFLDLRGSPLHRKYLGEEQILKFSPAAALAQSAGTLPPIFVARAGKDQIPDLQPGLDRFVAEAIARNVALEFVNQPDGEHGFDNAPGDQRSRDIVRQAVEFLQRNLAEK
jgi:acetyl esterase/lipase